MRKFVFKLNRQPKIEVIERKAAQCTFSTFKTYRNVTNTTKIIKEAACSTFVTLYMNIICLLNNYWVRICWRMCCSVYCDFKCEFNLQNTEQTHQIFFAFTRVDLQEALEIRFPSSQVFFWVIDLPHACIISFNITWSFLAFKLWSILAPEQTRNFTQGRCPSAVAKWTKKYRITI